MRSLLILTLLLLLAAPARAGTYEHHTLSAASPGSTAGRRSVAAPGGFVAAGAAAGGLSGSRSGRGRGSRPATWRTGSTPPPPDTTIADLEFERAVAGHRRRRLEHAVRGDRGRALAQRAWDVPSADRPWGRVAATGLGAERLVALLQCGGPHVCVAAGTASMQLRAARVVLHDGHAPGRRPSRATWPRDQVLCAAPRRSRSPRPIAAAACTGRSPRSTACPGRRCRSATAAAAT